MANAKYRIIVVGAGGTGSYYLKEISRFLVGRKDIISPYIIDGDFVEEKNLQRQSFLPEDIGRNKAIVMAEILGEAFEIPWKAIPSYLLSKEELKTKIDSSLNEITILVGCCDNHAARKVMEDYFFNSESCIYLDAANEFKTGQIVVAAKFKKKIAGLPRSFYFPNLFDGDMRTVEEMSCEELNQAAPQHIFTNMHAAQKLCILTAQFIEEGCLETGICFFDDSPGAHSEEFTPYNVVLERMKKKKGA